MPDISDAIIKPLLAKSTRIAIIGAKDKAGHPVDRVGRYLMDAGYTILPVHPVRKNIWGLQSYTKLTDIEEPLDIINLFRAAEFCEEHARECLTLQHKPQLFWMQLGIDNQEARNLLTPQVIHVIANKCLMVEHARLFDRKIRVL